MAASPTGASTIAGFLIAPIGIEESPSAHIARAPKIIAASGVTCGHSAMGMNLKRGRDEANAVINARRDRLLEASNRVSVSIEIDDRGGVTNALRHRAAEAKRHRG